LYYLLKNEYFSDLPPWFVSHEPHSSAAMVCIHESHFSFCKTVRDTNRGGIYLWQCRAFVITAV